jgi:hypothetical protein
MKYYYVHFPNFQKGYSIGDLFNSLLVLSQHEKNEKNTLLIHKSLVPFVKCIFPGLIDEFIFYPDSNHFTRIHKNFVLISNIINSPLSLKIDHKLFDINNKLLPNDSILLILNCSKQSLLNQDITNTILKECSNKKIYIRNVIDNPNYKNSIVKHNNCKSYEEDLMSLIESCIKRKIKIIMNRNGLVDVLAYITKIPIFIIYPDDSDWIQYFNFGCHKKNEYLNNAMNPNITEYFISNNNNDLEQKLHKFLNNNSD